MLATSAPPSFLRNYIVKSWWVILFFFICYFVYDQGSLRQQKQVEQLSSKLAQLGEQKQKALERETELRLQLCSQDDPEYIEMVLMRKLGLVQEGQTKVLFVK